MTKKNGATACRIWPCGTRVMCHRGLTVLTHDHFDDSSAGESFSAPHFLVHHIPQRMPLDKPPQIVQERLQMPLWHARRRGGTVRRQDHVLHAPERMLLRQRLDLVNVEPRP